MKKFQILWIIPIFMIMSCLTGKTSKDGVILKPYLEPAKLQELVEMPKDDI